MTRDHVLRRPAILLLWVSGAAGLAHQVIWTRRLVDVLGASPDTFSKVIGAFFIGLALGGAWSALKPASTPTAWRRVALAELAVALLGMVVLAAIPVAEWLHHLPAAGVWLKPVLPVLLVTPPAVAMGLVLPAVLAATQVRDAAVWYYAVNTLGGVAGIALVVFVGLPTLGLVGAGLAACALSLAVAVSALGLQRWSAKAPPTATASVEVVADLPLPAGLLAFLSGFLVLGLEVIGQQQFAQVTVNSHFSSAAVLAVVLLALTAASLVVAWLKVPTRTLLPVTLALAALAWTVQPACFLTLRPGLQIIPYELPPRAYFSGVALLAFVTLAPGFFAAGFTFPLLLREVPNARAVARLLALNGVGGWLGAELTQGLLLPAFGLWRAVLVAAAVYLALFAAALLGRRRAGTPTIPAKPGRVRRRFLPGLVPLALAGFLGVMWLRLGRAPQVSPAPGERVVEVAVGREGVVATVVRETNDWRIIFNNTYTLGGSRAQANQERQAHLPLLLHGAPKSVALLGVATGSTLAGAALHPGVERIEAFELSPLAARFARDHFAPYNRDVFRDPRVHLTVEDARWGISQQPDRFDVVVGDLFLPWRTGEGRLFTREHFAHVRRSLRPGGLFCQWLPLFQLTRAQFEIIARTFRTEFPDAFLLRGDFYPDLPIVGLCGFADGRPLAAVDWTAVEAACGRLRAAPDAVTDPLVRHAEGVAMCVVGNLPVPPPGPMNTLGNAHLEWDAGRNVVGLQTPWFIGVPQAEYLRDIVRADAHLLPSALRPAQDSGQFFLTLEIAAKVNAPVLANLRAQVQDRLPAALRQDPEASWRHWPGRVKPFGGDW